MKRALAERAKQSGLPNGVASPGAPPSGGVGLAPSESLSSPSQQPLKVPRIESPRVQAQAPPPTPAVSTPAASPRTKGAKRQRQQELNNSEDEEDDANASAFYLRHQNRALASELSQCKYQLKNLERERDYRRVQCSKACQSLNSLQATWTQMEAALQLGQPPPSSIMGGASDSNTNTSTSINNNTVSPPSTGARKSVELIGALLDSLAALGNNGSSTSKRRIDDQGQHEDDDSNTSSINDNHGLTMEGAEQQQLDDLLRITDNIAQRAATLQDWIWSLLPKVEGAPVAVSDAAQLSQQLARQKAKVKTLKQELKELARTRDEMQQSEKRVRRGLYRLAAGRVNLKEVLEAIETADEDKEAAAAWMEVAPAQPATVVPSSVAPTTAKPDDNGETAPSVNSAQLAQLQQQLKNLEDVASARDEQIQTVSAIVVHIHATVMLSCHHSHNYPSLLTFPVPCIFSSHHTTIVTRRTGRASKKNQ
jgi:predicted nuclease with TOPRIM domain